MKNYMRCSLNFVHFTLRTSLEGIQKKEGKIIDVGGLWLVILELQLLF
jgi:hypothetical protein